MNKIFSLVFNAARGTTMVVNEATSSVQTGKKAAVTVAVLGALAAGTAFADNVKTDSVIGATWLETESPSVTVTDLTEYTRITTQLVQANGIFDGLSRTLNVTDTVGKIAVVRTLQNLGGEVTVVGGMDLTNISNLKGPGGNYGISAYDQAMGTKLPSTQVSGSVKLVTELTSTNKSDWANGLRVAAGDFAATAASANDTVFISAKNAGYSAQAIGFSGGTLSFKGYKSVDIVSEGTGANGIAHLASSGAIVFEDIGTLGIVAKATDNVSNAMGVMLTGGDSLTVKGVDTMNVAVQGAGTTAANGTAGFYLDGADATLDVGTLNVDVQSPALSTPSAKYDHARGLKVVGGGSLKATGNVNIDVKDGNTAAYGAYASEGGRIELGGEGAVIDIKAAGVDEGYGLIATKQGSSIVVKGDELSIEATGKDARGVHVSSNKLGLADDQKSRVELAAKSIRIRADKGLVAMSEGQLSVEGDLDLEAAKAVVARGNSKTEINKSGKHTVRMKGDIDFNFDPVTSGSGVDATVDINLTDADSVLEGNVIKTPETIPADKDGVSGMRLGLKNGARWASNDDSFVNQLDAEGGVIDMSGNSGKVEVGVQNGAAELVMNADNPGSYAVQQEGEGAALTVTMTGDADTVSDEAAKGVMQNVTGVTNTTGVLAEGDVVGQKVFGADGSLVSQSTNTVLSNVMDLMSGGTLTLNRIAMNDVRKRLGDLRSAEGTHGVWARYDGGRLSGSRGFENDFHTLQFGVDTMPAADAPRFGVAFAYTKSDADLNRGGAEMDAYSLAAYATKLYDNGLFVDVIGRLAKADTDVVIDGRNTGAMDNLAVSLSGEIGWRLNMTERHYVEPQVELTYTRINGSTMQMANGTSYDLDNVDSLIGRAGFVAGFTCPSDKGGVYVRASAVHEFAGDARITGTKANLTGGLNVDGKDTWFEYGIGANFNVNKNTYVYADIERTAGAALDEDWRANVGVRYSF